MQKNYGVSKWPDIEEINSKMDKLLHADVLHIKADARARYMDYFDTKCKRSKEIIAEARQYIPGGVQHNLAFNYQIGRAHV